MGIAIADYDLDGDMDFFVTDASEEDPDRILSGNDFYINKLGDGDLLIAHSGNDVVLSDSIGGGYTAGADLNALTHTVAGGFFGWGTVFGDFDNDGDPDLYACVRHGSTEGHDGLNQFGQPDPLGEGNHLVPPLDPVQPLAWPPSEDARAWDTVLANQRLENPAAFTTPVLPDQMLEYFPAFVEPRNLGNSNQFLGHYTDDTGVLDGWVRVHESRNVLAGDYDQDGWLDLVVLPSTARQTDRDTLQVFRNTSEALQGGPQAANRHLRITLVHPAPPAAGDPGAALVSRQAVGARLRIEVYPDPGQGGPLAMVQTRELRIGESNGASTHSLPLEIGLGQNDSCRITVTWPDGIQSVHEVDVPPDSVLLSHPGGTLPQIPWAYDAAFVVAPEIAPGGPVNPDGMQLRSIQRTLTGLPPAGSEAWPVVSTLELTPSSKTVLWRPVAMDHLPDAQGAFEFWIRPLRLPLDHVAGIPQPTLFDLKIRTMDRFGQAKNSTSAAALEVRPEEISGGSDAGWSASAGTPDIQPDRTVLQAGDEIRRFFDFPGSTDFHPYSFVLEAALDAGAQGSTTLKVEADYELVKLSATAATYTDFQGEDARETVSVQGTAPEWYPLSLQMPPWRRWYDTDPQSPELGVAVRIRHLGAAGAPAVVLTRILRARKVPYTTPE